MESEDEVLDDLLLKNHKKRWPYRFTKKSQQTVEVPNCVIVEHSLGMKKTATFHEIHQDAQPMSIALRDAGRTAYKLDLAYVLSNMVCANDKTPLPGWTGFNTMLHEEIPDVQSVGYLPVINALPIEYATIKEILQQSKSIIE
ncbi:Hypothetical predicted protein [Paramuricea clavata]|uniref:Uncharacterized protein n=1 Tax=Paramuricea clavata TaxID=317549 RepID=A0A6S7ITD4_PARCT|nr:Hypothetical predicted protein [Paramuricea clavata]